MNIELTDNGTRPKGTDYDKPDPEEIRCPICNYDGLNRTGKVTSQAANSVSLLYEIPCWNGCHFGMMKTIHL